MSNRRRVRVKTCRVCGHRFADCETIVQHMSARHPRPNEFCCVWSCQQCGLRKEFFSSTMREAKRLADVFICPCSTTQESRDEELRRRGAERGEYELPSVADPMPAAREIERTGGDEIGEVIE